jgi:eukaryotic-like serine/threonine-protein kinase
VSGILERLSVSLADRYRLERELGAGGMATVYLAHDLRHNRSVALKVLRPELGAILGAERFLKEIQLTANLQHPHILPLHDSGEADGLVYYVMPFVEGESLRDRLNRERQLPVEEAVRIATEVADALQYAHEHGVVHRDIKPENILLHGGHAMVADFGIALAASRSDGGSRMTETGMSLGTPHYMAPEQAMGEKEVTAKADVYALGCVLYEMLVGEPPFTGPTAQAIIARVMTEAPRSLTLQRHTVPANLEAVVRMALEKLPADRFASAAQFASALKNPGSIPSGMTGAFPQAAESVAIRRRLITMVGIGALAAASGAGLWAWFGSAPALPVPPVVRFGIVLPRGAEPVGATGSTIAISPDGSRIVYVGKASSGQRLYSRGMDQLDPVPIPGSEGGLLPFFSYDGQWLGFKQAGRLVKVALAGGPVTPLCDAKGETYGAAWTTSDTIIFGSDSGLMQVPATGGKASLLANPDSGERFQWPEILPGNRTILFSVFGKGYLQVAALTRRSGEVKRLSIPGGYPRYVNQGFIVVSDPKGPMLAVPFDVRGLKATGPAVPITDLGPSPSGDQNMGVSRSGQFAYQFSPTAGARLVLVNRNGTVRDAGSDTSFYESPQLSPDGWRIAVTRYADINFRARDIWMLDLAHHAHTRLTFDTVANNPRWTPDGRRIAYGDGLGDTTNIYWMSADGSGSPERLQAASGRWWPMAFEPGGRHLIYHGLSKPGAKAEIGHLDIGGDRTSNQLLSSTFHNYDPSLSPDGRWLAYISDESGRFEVYVRPYPGPGGRWQVSLEGGAEPKWSATGREIFYRNGEQMMSAAVRTQPTFEVGARTQLFTGAYVQLSSLVTNYDVSRDGQTFLMLQSVQGTEQSLDVTLNWFERLRASSRRE